MDEIPEDVDSAVVTIGVFDGVHRGHQELISAAVGKSRATGQQSVLVTFDPHPVSVFLPERAPLALGTFDQRMSVVDKMGIDNVMVIDFTKEMAGWSPQEYVDRLLVGKLHANHVIIGENFTFGKNAVGTPDVMRQLCQPYGISVDVVDLLHDRLRESDLPAQDHTLICSTAIRKFLATGDVVSARWALGRPFSVYGPIVRGAGREARSWAFRRRTSIFRTTSRCLPTACMPAGLWLKAQTHRSMEISFRVLLMLPPYRWEPTRLLAMTSAAWNLSCWTGMQISTVSVPPCISSLVSVRWRSTTA